MILRPYKYFLKQTARIGQFASFQRFPLVNLLLITTLGTILTGAVSDNLTFYYLTAWKAYWRLPTPTNKQGKRWNHRIVVAGN